MRSLQSNHGNSAKKPLFLQHEKTRLSETPIFSQHFSYFLFFLARKNTLALAPAPALARK
jgi:hypothetical protein